MILVIFSFTLITMQLKYIIIKKLIYYILKEAEESRAESHSKIFYVLFIDFQAHLNTIVIKICSRIKLFCYRKTFVQFPTKVYYLAICFIRYKNVENTNGFIQHLILTPLTYNI